MNRLLLLSFLGFLLFSSCETNNYFQSESKMNSDIQRTWKLVPIPTTNDQEDWTFSDGKLSRLRYTGGGGTIHDEGTYSVSTTWTDAFLQVDGIKPLDDYLNGKWSIIELNGKDLIIAIKKTGSGIVEREFLPK